MKLAHCARCFGPKDAYRAYYCFGCFYKANYEMQKASARVRRAIRAGKLAKPSTMYCADCGDPAKVYDHRDYSRPLDVEPVCVRCNMKRGPAMHPPLLEEAAC